MLGEYVIRHRAGTETGGRDAQGNPIREADSVVPVPIRVFAPGVPDESAEAFGSQVSEAGTIYAFRGTDLRSTDRVEIRGEMWQVHSEPQDWKRRNRYAPEGCVVLVRRAS